MLFFILLCNKLFLFLIFFHISLKLELNGTSMDAGFALRVYTHISMLSSDRSYHIPT